MALRLLFFAGVREAVGRSSDSIALPPGVNSVGALRQHLAAQGESWSALGPDRRLRFAVNRAIADADTPLADGDEIAVFPPVTGG